MIGPDRMRPEVTMSQDRPTPVSRRRLFAGAGTAGALAAAAVALPLARKEAAPESTPLPDAPEKGGGYRLSEHVLRYYQTTRV